MDAVQRIAVQLLATVDKAMRIVVQDAKRV